MANEEQVKILKQGVDVWNKWRKENPDEEIDLREANLRRANLSEANLSVANLVGIILVSANLTRASLSGTSLSRANLRGASLSGANLTGANLSGASLVDTSLSLANLADANLSDAQLMGADLIKTNLQRTNLSGSKFTNASLADTFFGLTDLSEIIGIDKAVHYAPSTIGTDTLAASKGKIPEVFLRSCGLSDWEIESSKLYNPDLTNEEIVKVQYRIYDLRATQAIQISPLFISYSHVDKPFVDFLDTALTEKGVRFWRDIHDATAGRLETQIDRAIRQNPIVLLILSKNSIKSDWVEHEVRTARGLEKELGRDAFCPIALDDGWKSSPWPKHVMEQIMEYNILDFSDWENKSAFEGKFAKLLNGLDLFYKKSKE